MPTETSVATLELTGVVKASGFLGCSHLCAKVRLCRVCDHMMEEEELACSE
jgi:hypothetical protein